jgi:hypothetical protein
MRLDGKTFVITGAACVGGVVRLIDRGASAREEQARQAARRLVHDLETAWAGLLERGMAAGVFPRRDPHTLAQAVLGLLVSVWRWYRWGGRLDLAEVRDFYTGCVRRMVDAG